MRVCILMNVARVPRTWRFAIFYCCVCSYIYFSVFRHTSAIDSTASDEMWYCWSTRTPRYCHRRRCSRISRFPKDEKCRAPCTKFHFRRTMFASAYFFITKKATTTLRNERQVNKSEQRNDVIARFVVRFVSTIGEVEQVLGKRKNDGSEQWMSP